MVNIGSNKDNLKGARERELFTSFARRSGVDVKDIQSQKPPAPDVLSCFRGEYVSFEIFELKDEKMSSSISNGMKNSTFHRRCSFLDIKRGNLSRVLIKKIQKEYISKFPIELLILKDSIFNLFIDEEWLCEINILIDNIGFGCFRRIWYCGDGEPLSVQASANERFQCYNEDELTRTLA